MSPFDHNFILSTWLLIIEQGLGYTPKHNIKQINKLTQRYTNKGDNQQLQLARRRNQQPYTSPHGTTVTIIIIIHFYYYYY